MLEDTMENLTEAEKQLIADFRAALTGGHEVDPLAAVVAAGGGEVGYAEGEPDALVKSVSVVNESLGQTPRGEKIQFRSGKPGWKPEPAPRGMKRFLARTSRQDEARAEAKKRAAKGRTNTLQLVAGFKEKLAKMNVAEAVAFITDLSEHDRERAALAEELGEGRVTVLRAVGKVSEKTRAEYTEQLAQLSAVLKNDSNEEYAKNRTDTKSAADA